MTELDLNREASEEFLRDRKNLVEVIRLTSGLSTEESLSDRAAAVVEYANHYSCVDEYPLSYFVDSEGEFQLDDFAGALANLFHKAQPKIRPDSAELLIKASMNHYMGEANCRGKSGDKVAVWRSEREEDVIARAASLTLLGFLCDAVPEKLHAQHEARLDEMVRDAKERISASVIGSLENDRDTAGFVYVFSTDDEPVRDVIKDGYSEQQTVDIDIAQKEFLFRLGLVDSESPELIELPKDLQEFPITHMGYPGYSLYINVIPETDHERKHYYYSVDISSVDEQS